MKEQLIKLLKEIIKAGKTNKETAFDMARFHCGTSCCLCGGWVMVFGGESNTSIEMGGANLASDLDSLMYKVCSPYGYPACCGCIYEVDATERRYWACQSKFFSAKELRHPHLTEDHNDRKIAHDFIRLVISKLEEL